MNEHIYIIDDVPDDYKLGDAQQMQVSAHKKRQPIIRRDAIEQALNAYKFPLYFLDYETYAPAIPAFDGFSPYKKIPFQFSLHILRDQGNTPEHIEYLHRERSDPTPSIADLLERHIGPIGTVVVWFAPFEKGVNKEIGERLGRYASQMGRINGQVLDLQDIFAKQHYVHPAFRGGTSIKDVMPVLVPELSYDDLEIREGATASEQWWKMTANNTPAEERERIAQALRVYCGLDSYAMFAIWRKLQEVVCAGHSRSLEYLAHT